jgi:uncharacterized membrane protein
MKTNRYLVGGLIASVAINLALVGFLAGRASTMEFNNMSRVDPMMGMRTLLRDLPEDRQETLMPRFREYFSALRPRFRDIRGAQGSLREAILSDPLDTAALQQALNNFNTNLFASQANGHEALIALIAALNAEERKQLIVNLHKPPRHPSRRPPNRTRSGEHR